MKRKFLIGTVTVGIAAFIIGSFLWPLPPEGPFPHGAQWPFLIFLDLVQSLLFGLGMVLLVWGWPLFKWLPLRTRKEKTAVFVSTVWLFASWWPHIGFHISAGDNLWMLIAIDYTFHLTVIIASLVILRALISIAKRSQTVSYKDTSDIP